MEYRKRKVWLHPLLILSAEGIFLLDPGVGLLPPGEDENFPRKKVHFPIDLCLSHYGVKPDEIRYVLLTHLHFDHIGNLLQSHKLTFRHAIHIIPRAELKRLEQPHPDQPSFLYNRSFYLTFLSHAPDLRYVEKPVHITPWMEMIPTGGHSPGHSIFLFTPEEKKKIIHTGDLFIFPFFLTPGRNLNVHENPAIIEEWKKRVQDWLREGSRFYFYHSENSWFTREEQ
ncbi:MAG: MBL fold metallo-hydrolase [bacterium JZ-2024 1]